MPDFIVHPDGERLRQYDPEVGILFEDQLPKHIKNVKLFTLADYKPGLHPEQRMDTIGVRGRVDTAETLRSIGRQAFGSDTFDTYSGAFSKAEQTLYDTLEYIKNGEHVIFGTTHQKTDDIAAFYAAFLAELQDFMVHHPDLSIPLDSRFIISKLITGLNAKIDDNEYYIPRLLTVLGDTYFSLPASRTMQESGLNHDVRTSYNEAIETALFPDVEKDRLQIIGGTLTAFALNGSTYVDTGHRFGKYRDEPRIHCSPVTTGTQHMLSRGVVLPVAGNINHTRHHPPEIKIGHMRKIHNPKDTVVMMNELMDHMTTLTGRLHTYHPTRENYDQALPNKTIPVISTY